MSKPLLSVVIAAYNDNVELYATVASIRNTSPSEHVEVIVIDDASSLPISTQTIATVFRNSRRIGCGPSRYVGAVHATGTYLLFCDSHMRFSNGWFEAVKDRLEPKILFCGRCLGLGRTKDGVENMDVNNPNGVYSGATFNFFGPDRVYPKLHQVLECVWAPEKASDEYAIPAVMGACYFIHRDWFLSLDALRHLRLWGGDEQELSLKAWLSGGEVRLLKNVHIGHKFRTGSVSSSFVMPKDIIRNKLFIIHTCLPPEMAMRLERKFPRGLHTSLALKAIQDEWHVVETARAYNSKLFERSFYWYLERFGLAFPEK